MVEILIFRNTLIGAGDGRSFRELHAHRIILTMGLGTRGDIVANIDTGNDITISNPIGGELDTVAFDKQRNNDRPYLYKMGYDGEDVLSFYVRPQGINDFSGSTVIVRTYSVYNELPTEVDKIVLVQEFTETPT